MVERPLMVRWVVGSITHVGPIELFAISLFSQCYTTSITNAVVYTILSVGWCI